MHARMHARTLALFFQDRNPADLGQAAHTLDVLMPNPAGRVQNDTCAHAHTHDLPCDG